MLREIAYRVKKAKTYSSVHTHEELFQRNPFRLHLRKTVVLKTHAQINYLSTTLPYRPGTLKVVMAVTVTDLTKLSLMSGKMQLFKIQKPQNRTDFTKKRVS